MANTKRKRSYSSSRVSYKRNKATRQQTGTVPRARGPTATMQKTELHYYDTERESFSGGIANTIVANATSWANSVQLPTTLGRTTLFAPVLGNSIQDRTARTAFVKKIKLRGVLWYLPVEQPAPPVAQLTPPKIRIILVQDDQANGTLATGNEIMRVTAGASNNLPFSTFQSLDNLGRFKVLKDKIYEFPNEDGYTVFNNAGTPGTEVAPWRAKLVKWTVNFKKPVKVHFNATNNNSVASVVAPTFNIYARDYVADINQTYFDYCCRFTFLP